YVGGEAVTEAYLIDGFVAPCALLPEDIQKTLCGPIGDIIHKIADAAGHITDDLLDAITHPLNIPDDILNVLGAVLTAVDPPDPKFCPPPSQYYANSYARCYHRGVRQLSSNPAQFDQLVQSLNSRCRIDHYDHCFKTKVTENVNPICNPQMGMFSNHMNQLVLSVNNAASSYTRLFPQFVREQGPAAACDRQSFMGQAFQTFLDQCAKKVAAQVPLLGDPD